MGLGSDFSCCSCKNLTKSVWLGDDNNGNQNKENNNINANANNNNTNDNRQIEANIINPEQKSSALFNKNGSRIVNATSFQPIELKLDIQPQQTDEFEDMFNQLSSKNENN